MNKIISFVYNYPDNTVEDTIIVETATDDIIICKWNENIEQWIDTSSPVKFAISYNKYDTRFSQGITKWCYYSDFKKFLNRQSILNIKHET